jgi:hypothetical protein
VKKRTILDSIVMVLDQVPRSASEIHGRIVGASLFEFKAQDPIAMVRAAIRAHLKSHGAAGQPPARVRVVERDRYVRT